MVIKLFAGASVSALAGLIVTISAAGCSTAEESLAETKDAAPDTKQADPPSSDEVIDPPVEPNPCEGDAASDVPAITYKPARVQAGACTENVFKVIEALVASNDEATWDDLQTAIETNESKACATCLFGG